MRVEMDPYSQSTEDVLNSQRQAYSQSKMAATSADISVQENETQPPVSISIGNDDQLSTYTPACCWH